MPYPKSKVTIISPALRQANNGNWHTAYRWSRFLRRGWDVDILSDWSPARDDEHPPQCLVALHARRSAPAIARFAEARPDRPLMLVLTGTDLYRDIRREESARRSLDLATHLVVLQEAGLEALEPAHRDKCRVIYQSAPFLKPAASNRRTFDVILVGHMRVEKDPLTPMRALRRLPAESRVRLIHVGEALNDEFARAAHELQALAWPSVQRYRWLGGRPHGETRQRIRRARAMVISSVMEGGANVIIEAVTSGVPVVASRMSGNIGMLGRDYGGYFAVGDDQELAALLERISHDADFLQHLRRQCARRAPLFDPAREEAEVNRLLDDALGGRGRPLHEDGIPIEVDPLG
jgi:putative glycosyltransferase (TIGR04348 family)